MNILIVAATHIEIEPLLSKVDKNVEFLVTGIGAPITILKLCKVLCFNNYDLIINVGIAGAFNKDLNIGDVVQVESDLFADIGFEDNQQFIPISNSKFTESAYNKILYCDKDLLYSKLPNVKGITVNSVSGSASTIKTRQEIFKADIESMEGAAVALVADNFNIPKVQIRSISNFVEVRNKSSWDIPLATKNLSLKVLNFIEQLKKN